MADQEMAGVSTQKPSRKQKKTNGPVIRPKYIDMIQEAVTQLRIKNVFPSKKNILKYICMNYPIKDENRAKFYLNRALKSCIRNRYLKLINIVGRAQVYLHCKDKPTFNSQARLDFSEMPKTELQTKTKKLTAKKKTTE